MRRKINLYIADRLVDLDEQSLILFNYTMEDLQNPTIVLNSYSQQITINGTQNNNKLFGDIFRCDRSVTYNGGTTGTHELAQTKEDILPWGREQISQALGHDMENYIRKLVRE